MCLPAARGDASAGGATALHRAAHQGHCAVLSALLSAGADAAAQDNDGETALHKASRQVRRKRAFPAHAR